MSRFNPDRLEALREAHGLNKTDFAKKAGLTRQAYDQLLKGKNKPNISTLERIAEAFQVACGYFFTCDDHQNGERKRVHASS